VRLLKSELLRSDLSEMSLFSDSSRSQLAKIEKCLCPVEVSAGKVLVHQGSRGNEFMIIVEGLAQISQSGRPIARSGRGDLVGEMALLHEGGRGKRNATATALTDMSILVGTPTEFRHILDISSTVAEKVRHCAASRILQSA
jgi:CRP-like cAMP-binding protein